jgi:beta-N-acetylhexosaminidase
MMNGATQYAGSLSRAAKQALIAGNDIIMFSQTPNLNDMVWTYLLSSMKEEPEFRQRVLDACRRVLAMKLEYLRGEKKVPYIPDLKKVEDELTDPEGAAFFLDLAARSVTLVNGKDVFPLTQQKAGKVLLVGNYNEFFSAGRNAFPNAVSYRYNPPQAATELIALARNADTIIFCLEDRAGSRALQQLRDLNKRVIAFSVLSPAYLDEVSWADASVAVYSYSTESFIAGFSAILGRISGGGRLPFTLNGRP